ncbi:tRNA(Ile)-lysidine synthetase [Acinetobacter sp. Ver3]|nr:tRNA(Ile)-lysidine synthetase [Acinetobacter sp. Ver3]
MDSMLLLYVMSQLIPQKIRAININHQLQSANQEWAEFVHQFCMAAHIPVVLETVQIAEGNLEQQARAARYQAFKHHLSDTDILVLAHHQQDQAETVLLRLFSGAGIQGLSAMKLLDSREDIIIWRPLLNLSREQICQWVEQLKLPYVDDPTNFDTHYDRAWCRHELWNILQSRFPKMQQAIVRTSVLMQDADEILQEILQQDLAFCGDDDHLDLRQLNQLSLARRRQLLSNWMKGKDQYRPAFEMVERLTEEVILAKPDAQAALHWNGQYYVRFRNILYRVAKDEYLAESNTTDSEIKFEIQQVVNLASGQFKICQHHEECGLRTELLNQSLTLHYRQGGEKVHLHGRVGKWPLKKAIQEAQIFPWKRHTIQILSLDNVMLGVFTPKGFWLAESEYCEVGGWQPKLVSSL